MARLADYMTSFAELLGQRDHVHFGELKQGSRVVAACVDEIAQRKVERRVEEVRFGQGPESARRALRDIDDKLAEDNAIGHILRGGKAKVIEFAGRTRHVEAQLGPVEQAGAIEGQIVQIGGRDETINVHLKAGDQFHLCITSKATARRLAEYIFGGPIRARGKGVWARMESGTWTLKRFVIEDFDPLDETPLSKLFDGLRERLVPPACGRMNPVDLMRQLREE